MKIAVLGSTGSVGTQTLDVAARHNIEIAALAAGSNVDLLVEQIRQFRPALAAVADDAAAERLEARLAADRELRSSGCRIVSGRAGIVACATIETADKVVCALSGFRGLESALAAIEAGKDIALANKETLVAAGELVIRTAEREGVRVLPVDSEHAAVFQCLGGRRLRAGEMIFLTCSGGPFYGRNADDLAGVSVEEALRHPTWQMGKKISIDSATLMNKALELIEAHHLFAAAGDQIEIVIHRESIVHSLVRLADGSVPAILGHPDMRLPILQALFYPETVRSDLVRPFDPRVGRARTLTFDDVDEAVFPSIAMARRALGKGGVMPLVLNAANEAAVALFLSKRIAFTAIFDVVERCMLWYAERAGDILPASFDDMMKIHEDVFVLADNIGAEAKPYPPHL